MKTNNWMKEGGFYWKDARVISDAGLDIAAHPKVLIKEAEISRISAEENKEVYREKMLRLVWKNRWFDDKIWDSRSNAHLLQGVMKKLRSGWDFTSQEAELFFELLKSGVIQSRWIKSEKSTETISLGYEVWPDLADIFEDAEGKDSRIKNILMQVAWVLDDTEISPETWIEALKCCQDKSFKPNVKVMNSTVIMEELMLRLKNPIVLLRFHLLQMEAYRGTNKDNDHWIGEMNWPSCTSCGEEIAGSQNFTRAAWAALHTSCIPDYLKKNHADKKHAEYMKAVYDAMFPQQVPTK